MAKCLGCGYRGTTDDNGLRTGPKCQGRCVWDNERAPQDPELFPPLYETGDVVQWGEQVAVVVSQVCRDGAVMVAVQGRAFMCGPRELTMIQAQERVA